MQSNQKEVQKKKEVKGHLYSQKIYLNINSMREEKQNVKTQTQDSNEQGSTSYSEEFKKKEEKPKSEKNSENFTKNEVNPNNEDRKIQKQVENSSLPSNNINGVNIPLGNLSLEEIREQEKRFYNLSNRALFYLLDPNNVNHDLLNNSK